MGLEDDSSRGAGIPNRFGLPMGEPEAKRARPNWAAVSSVKTLAELTASQKGRVNLIVCVRAILPQQVSCSKSGAKISLCKVKLADDSDPFSSISLQLWRQKADLWAAKLQVGDVLLLPNVAVKQWRRDFPLEVSLQAHEDIRVLVRKQALAHSPAAAAPTTEGPEDPWSKRVSAVKAFAASVGGIHEAASSRRCGNVPALAYELVRHGPKESPEWCGNVCGGWCELVRAATAGTSPAERRPTDCDTACNGFQRIEKLTNFCQAGGQGSRVPAVCGRLTLQREGVSACKALLNSSSKSARIPALLSCRGLHPDRRTCSTAPLFCNILVLGKHARDLASFFERLDRSRLKSPRPELKEQCIAQFFDAVFSNDDGHAEYGLLTVDSPSSMYLWQLPPRHAGRGFARMCVAEGEETWSDDAAACGVEKVLHREPGTSLRDLLGRGLGPTRVREQARIRCLHFDCGPRGLVRASDICASTLTLLSRVACARCGADVRLTDDGITLCTRCAPAPEEASGALFRWRWAPAEVLLECREGILVSASLADAAVASLFGFSAQLLHEEEEEEDKEAARAETIGVGGFGGTVAGRVPRVGTVGRAVLDMCSGLESRLHEGVEEQELWVDMDFDESLDTSGVVVDRHVTALSFSFFT